MDVAFDDLDEDQQQLVNSLNLWEVVADQIHAERALDASLTRFPLKRIYELEVLGDIQLPPHRPRHRSGIAQKPLHRGRLGPAAGARHGLLRGARHLPGRAGARIEDIAVCTADGGERLRP